MADALSASIFISEAVSSGTSGSVLFVGPTGLLAQNNAAFFWDNTALSLNLTGAAAGNIAEQFRVTGDTFNRFQIAADGTQSWGSGAAAADVTLARTGIGELKVSNVGAPVSFDIDGSAGVVRDLRLQTAGIARWIVRANGTAEGGANAGSDFTIIARNDAGGGIFNSLLITRSTGLWTIGGTVQADTDNAFDLGGAGNKWRNIRWGTQALGPDGAATSGNVSFSFANSTDTGMYRFAAGQIGFATAGSARARFGNSFGEIAGTLILTNGALNSGVDVRMSCPSSHVLEIVNTTNAQTFRIYGTTTGPKYLSLSHNGTDGLLDVAAASGKLILGGNASDIQWGKGLIALGGGAAPTFGTIGGAGPATAAQNTWMRVLDSAGAAFWVPAWK